MLPQGYLAASESLLRSNAHVSSLKLRLRPSLISQQRIGHATIAIGREIGTPAGEVARELASRLDWRVYDQELIKLIADQLHVDVRDVERIDERHLGWLEECAEWFLLPKYHISEARYAACTTQAIHALANAGQAVIVGRGSAFLVPASTSLRVRLVAPLADRIRDIAQRRSLSLHDAEVFIDEMTRQQSAFIREHFHADPDNARNYDIVINTARWSLSECCDLIVKALGQLNEYGQA